MARTPGKQTLTLMGAEVRRDANESSANDRCSATDFVPPLIRVGKPKHVAFLRKHGLWPAGAESGHWLIRLPAYDKEANGLNEYMTDDKQRVLAFKYINDAADFLDDHHRSTPAEAVSASGLHLLLPER
jgi:hypothetical protein